MARSREHLPYEQALQDLVDEYARAQRELVTQLQAALASKDLVRASVRRAQLAAALRVLDALGQRTDPRARRLVADAYQQSAQHTSSLIPEQVKIRGPEQFAGVEQDAIRTLQETITGQLQDARVTVGRRVADVYARAGRRAALGHLLGAEGSPRAAARRLAGDLARQGVKSFVDRAGKKWALDTYADMAVRTTTREAVVEAAKTRMASQGVVLCQVTTHATSCPKCLPYEGRVFSLDGTSGTAGGVRFTPLVEQPPFHPRCRHTISPYVLTNFEAAA